MDNLEPKLKKIIVSHEFIGQRLDLFLSKKLNKSRAQAQKMIKNKLVTINKKNPKAHYSLKEKDIISINKNKKHDFLIPKIKIIHKTPNFIIIEKPAGILSQPLPNKHEASLIDALVEKFPEIKSVGEEQQRFGLVHRLDRDVSGIMVIARKQSSFEYLKNQFKERKIKKEYTALVHGIIKESEGKIDFPISRSKSGKMRATAQNQPGRSAVTTWRTEKKYLHHTLVKVFPQTGRMHQIRVHLKSIGHSIVGDRLYSIKKYGIDTSLGRIFLHATSLSFIDQQGEPQTFFSPLPTKLSEYLKQIKQAKL